MYMKVQVRATMTLCRAFPVLSRHRSRTPGNSYSALRAPRLPPCFQVLSREEPMTPQPAIRSIRMPSERAG